ncbi:hypothetical protein C2S52_004030 [Perilla frutescens var. hirtella]|nr:hypothetical protein C2S52_004030 [Perilla frutescens var. hirtella]
MAGNHHHPPPDAALFSAGNHHYQSDTASFSTGNHHQANSTFWAVGNQLSGAGFVPAPAVNHHNTDYLAAGNQLNTNNLALMNGNSRYTDTLLESEFARLSLMPAIRPAAFVTPPPSYDGGSSSSSNRNYSIFNDSSNGVSFAQSQLRDIQRMRIQSAARGQVGLYMQPQINSDFENFDDFCTNAANLNGISSYNMPNLYSSVRNLNGYNQPHHYSFRSNSSYDFGLENSMNSSSRNNNNNNGGINSSFQYRSLSADRIQTNNSVNQADWRNGGGSICRPRQRPSFSSLKDLRGRIFSVSKDQHGCRFLQTKFEEGKPEEIQMIFVEVKDHICELMVDQFGNYLVQKFLAACNQEQMTQLLLLVINDEDRFKDICVDSHGTRSVQKLLEFLTTAEQRSRVISVLRRITVPLTKSMNGHHVIQYCLKNFSVEDNKHILNVVADNCMEIALDKSGCCVLQQCVEHAIGEPRDRLISEITSNAIILSEHPYGNYVVQYILGLKIGQATADIIRQLSGNFVSLSMSKYGSNVVEKFLKDEPEENQVLPIIEEIIHSPNFLRVLQDPFGNYVAQSALKASKGVIRNAMANLIIENYSNLHSHPHGKRVLASVKGNKTRV